MVRATVSREAQRSAAATGDAELVRLLIAARRVDAGSDEARDLLALAAGHNTQITSLLLDTGADPNGNAGEHSTPLAAAVRSGSAERVRLLLSRGADQRRSEGIMRAAVSQNDSGIIALLVRAGADVNAQDRNGQTALIAASDMCSYWHIEALLAAGADPRVTNREGRTALQPQTALTTETESCRKSLATLANAVRR